VIRVAKPSIDKPWFYQTTYVKFTGNFQGMRYNRHMEEEFKPVIREDIIEARPWHMATEAKVDETEFDRRMSICRSCEFFRAKSEQCRKCGCFMKLKTKIERAHCPVHKW